MSTANPAFSRVMSTRIEAQAAKDAERYLRSIGPSEAVSRFVRCYAKVRVQRLYAFHLRSYFRSLGKKDIKLTPDELVVDNLRCIYRSEPEDVATKRKHRAWLEDYINEELGNHSESYRRLAVAAVRGFYERNDSPLFGRVTVATQLGKAPPKALKADDIRAVLRALPLGVRTPLLCMWQSGAEINRALGLRWRELEGLNTGEHPLRLSFYGRKRHRKPYYTFLGRDAVQHLKLWGEKWEEQVGRPPGPDDLVFMGKRQNGMDGTWLNFQFRKTALALARQGAVQNGSPESWHSHMLRHSFKTEAQHAGLKSEMVEFLMGHNGGIAQVYDNRDELHPEDFIEAYRKLEPHISLDYTEAVMTEKSEAKERALMSEFLQLKRNFDELKEELQFLRSERPSLG